MEEPTSAPPPRRPKKAVARKWSVLQPIYAEYIRRRSACLPVGEEGPGLSDELERRLKADRNTHAKWRKKANLPGERCRVFYTDHPIHHLITSVRSPHPGKLSMLRGSETEPPTMALAVEQEEIRKAIQYDRDARKVLCDIDSAIASIGIRKRQTRGEEQTKVDLEPDISMDDAMEAMRELYYASAAARQPGTAPSGEEKLQSLRTIMRVVSRAVTRAAWREDLEADDDVTYDDMEPIISFSSKIHKVHSVRDG